MLTEYFENLELVIFSDFAESGTLANFGFFSGGMLEYQSCIAGIFRIDIYNIVGGIAD